MRILYVCRYSSDCGYMRWRVTGFFFLDLFVSHLPSPPLPSPLLVTHLLSLSSEFKGLAPRALTPDLFIIFGLFSSTVILSAYIELLTLLTS